MDEIDAIGGKRFSEGTSSDREIQRTLMEVCATVSVSCTRRCVHLNLLTDGVMTAAVVEPNGRV
jgi:hypothetical protein